MVLYISQNVLYLYTENTLFVYINIVEVQVNRVRETNETILFAFYYIRGLGMETKCVSEAKQTIETKRPAAPPTLVALHYFLAQYSARTNIFELFYAF